MYSKLHVSLKQFMLSLLLVLILPLAFAVFTQADKILVLDLVLMSILFLICQRAFNRNIFFIGFLLSFFIFLLSGDVAEEIFQVHYWMQFDEDTNRHSHICIAISLIFLFLGYVTQRDIKPTLSTQEFVNKSLLSSIRTVSKTFFYITYPILIIETIHRVYFVITHGYIAYYLSYTSLFPAIISKLKDIPALALCVCLATMPLKKEVKLPITLYFIYIAIGFFGGQRGLLAYNLIFLIGYFLFRNVKYSFGEVWIKKKTLIFCISMMPVLFVLMFLYGYVRVGEEIVYSNFTDTLVKFFVNIGASSKVIKLGYIYENEIPEWRFYSFGSILNYLQYNKIYSFFTGETFQAHTIDFALSTHSFDDIISFLAYRANYLSGQGQGSSYIAVLYADFGYIGIAIGSFVYGKIFKSISNICIQDSWLINTIKLYMLLFLMKAPRGSYDGFLSPIINLFFIVCILLIYFFATLLIKRRGFLRT